jgi:orotidine 5'-phosphate decarboxylase subfamily 2
VGIVEATADVACAYKPNLAFFEALGAEGLAGLRATLAAVPPDVPVILDAKRADIGSTSAAYAAALFERLHADAVTVSPYLGFDALEPFFAFADRGVYVLCKTSNPGAAEFQDLRLWAWSSAPRTPTPFAASARWHRICHCSCPASVRKAGTWLRRSTRG